MKAAGGEIAQSDVDGVVAGPLRVWPGGLAMTRSLGDHEAGRIVIGEKGEGACIEVVCDCVCGCVCVREVVVGAVAVAGPLACVAWWPGDGTQPG